MKSLLRSKEHPIIMLQPSNGKVKNSNGKYVFVGKVYSTESINDDPEKIQELLQIFPRLNAHQLQTAKDGVYTWLLYSDEDSDVIRFVCTEVVSPFEIGTRHQSMAYNARVQAYKIYGGGELIKTGDTIQFNILSGTYSKPLVLDKREINAIVTSFKLYFPQADYDDSGDSYIHKVTTVSDELLNVYKKYGYIVRFFDTYNECAKFQNMFWNLDFNIEHYKKAMENATDANRHILKTLYMDAIQRMIELLEKTETKLRGGMRKTRRKTRRNTRYT